MAAWVLYSSWGAGGGEGGGVCSGNCRAGYGEEVATLIGGFQEASRSMGYIYRGRSDVRETNENQILQVPLDLIKTPIKIVGIDGDAGVILDKLYISRQNIVYAAMRHSPCRPG